MMKLYGYWRSSASYRVRIALALKGIEAENIAVNLLNGEHKNIAHISRNPQGFVPVLELSDGTQLTQSLAILDYLDAVYPEPKLLSGEALLDAKIKAAALVIAADIHPLQNPSVFKHVRAEYGDETDEAKTWMQYWIIKGFKALEVTAQAYDTEFFMTDTPSLVDVCLVPQVFNARRYGVDMAQFPRLNALDEACRAVPAFMAAHPSRQKGATI
ncbi:MAG: maleylacetoacetate isomerase [Maricaulaceae bacterium]